MKHDWHNVHAGKDPATISQEIYITIGNHNRFLVGERPLCSVEHLELGYTK